MVNQVNVYFHCFEVLNYAFEVQFFSGLQFDTIKDTDSMHVGHAAQIYFKVETLKGSTL